MDITIKNLQKKIPLSQVQIIRVLKRALDGLGVKTGSLSFVFTTDQRIKSLNRKYLKRSYATDVLAFDLDWNRSLKKKSFGKREAMAGEVIISTDTVVKNARLYGETPFNELKLCMIHGILHLLGYDDHRLNDIKRMRRKEKEILHFLS